MLFRNVDEPGLNTIRTYKRLGGYESLRRPSRRWQPDELLKELEDSGLRGRGGAGFSMGKKAGFLPRGDMDKYLCCNADESEPGAFKDRELMQKNPHQLIEGIIIAARAAGANRCFIFIRGEYDLQGDILDAAVEEAYNAGFLGDDVLGTGEQVELVVHRGAGAYICGEETALLDSLEGKRGNPRLKPPFPAVQGLYGGPTLINNVETLSNVPHIVASGADWFKSFGTEQSPGTKVVSVSGDVQRPGNYEVELGDPDAQADQRAGGRRQAGRRKIKCFFPGGSSSPVLTAEEGLDLPYSFEAMQEAGSMLGSGSIIVCDEETSIVELALRTAKFYHHESCGKCTPCREGTNWTVKMLERMIRGEATPIDLETVASVQKNIIGNCLCVLGDSMAAPIGSMVEKFREEFDEAIENGVPSYSRQRPPCRPRRGHRRGRARGGRPHVGGGGPLMPQPIRNAVTLVVDGREVIAPEGTMLVDAAKQGDVEIPVFCYEPKLGEPVGACRMCLVEIEGIPKLQTACSTPVRDGMVVYTQTDQVKEAQNAVVEFLLVNHPLDCPVCDKGGECPLQDISMGWGPGKSRFTDPKRHFQKPLELSPLVAIDRERCILCYRCVRFSQEVAEDEQLQLLERGDRSFVGTFDERPYVAPFHGNIIELCPVGALTSYTYRFRARPWDIEDAGSVCTLCPIPVQRQVHGPRRAGAAGAGPRQPRRRRRLALRQGPLRFQMFDSEDRITEPMVRAGDGILSPISWEDAIAKIAAKLEGAGPAAAALAGGGTSNEEGWLAQRVLRKALGGTAVASSPSPVDPALLRGALAARAELADVRPGLRRRDPRRRRRPAARDADPGPAHPQGGAPRRREAARRLRAPHRARRRRHRRRPLRPGGGAGVPGRAEARPSDRRAGGRGPVFESREAIAETLKSVPGPGDRLGRAPLAQRRAPWRPCTTSRASSTCTRRSDPACSRSPRSRTPAGCARPGSFPAPAPATPTRPPARRQTRSSRSSRATSSTRCSSSTPTRSGPTPTAPAGAPRSPARSSLRSRCSTTSPPRTPTSSCPPSPMPRRRAPSPTPTAACSASARTSRFRRGRVPGGGRCPRSSRRSARISASRRRRRSSPRHVRRSRSTATRRMRRSEAQGCVGPRGTPVLLGCRRRATGRSPPVLIRRPTTRRKG